MDKSPNEMADLRKQTIIVLSGAANEGQPAMDKLETLEFDEEGAKEVLLVQLKYASGCFHALASGRIGGVCAAPGCFRVLCQDCSRSSRCDRCARPVCYEHRKEQDVKSESVFLCPECVRWIQWKGWEQVAKWLAAALLGLLFFSQLFE